MKKKYVKPEARLVKFELSEGIAACGVKLYTNLTENSCPRNPVFEGFALAGDQESCQSYPLEGYCYFTSTSNLLMNS